MNEVGGQSLEAKGFSMPLVICVSWNWISTFYFSNLFSRKSSVKADEDIELSPIQISDPVDDFDENLKGLKRLKIILSSELDVENGSPAIR